MDDPFVVRGREAACDLHAVLDRSPRRERAADQLLAERLAVEQFHDGIGPRPVDSVIVNREDIRMRQRGDRLRFALEARETIRLGGKELR